MTTLKEWKFNSGGNPDRETDIAYQAISVPLFATNGGPTFVPSATVYKPNSVTVWDDKAFPGRMQLAQTLYSYDSAPLTSVTGSTNHDDSDYGTGNTQRGNLTTITRVTGGTNITFNYKYDTTGQVSTFLDPANNTTTYSYTDHFTSGSSFCGITTNAYPETVQYPPLQFTTLYDEFSYDCGTGQVTTHWNVSASVTYMTYNDVFSRLTLTNNITGAWTLNVYSSPTQTDIYRGITDNSQSPSCTACRHDQIVLDGIARVNNRKLLNDPDGAINHVLSYDTNGRFNSETNPYRSTLDTTYGTTTTVFDGLNRVAKITDPDGNVVNLAYGASVSNVAQNCTTTIYGYPELVTDEAGKQRLSWMDGFGRVIEVDEPNSSGTLSLATCYEYDQLGNLVTITQKGGSDSSHWRSSSFAYDWLSRLTSESTPESGATSYYYTTAAGGLCAADPQAICRKTDARGITTTYAYDVLSRLTSKTYSNTTPPVSYYYDQNTYNGLTISYGRGRRTGMSDGTGQTAWSYNAIGEVVAKRQTINGVTQTISYTYNLDGSVATMTSPNGHVYTYTYNNAQRPVSLSDNGSSITYVANAHYAAPGELVSASHGLNLAITETNSFNNRLQPTLLSAATTGNTLLRLSYNWVLPGDVNNGNVYQIQNNRDLSNNRSFQYTYDNLNRLLTAGTVAAATSPWTTTYGYDAWGNLLQKSTTGSGAPNGEPNMGPLTVDVYNHVNPTSYTYDASGNLTFDGVNALKYDAENRVNPVTGYVYSYDGDDHRVEKNNAGSITYYWYDDNFTVIATTGALARDYVYFNGRRIAFLGISTGNQHYTWANHLGSSGVMSNSSGSTIEWEADYFPFGTAHVLNNSVENKFRFTDYEWDSELGDNYASYREQSPVLGRFFSADPVRGDVTNPQRLNRYAYVINHPTVMADPLGLDPEHRGGACFFCIIGDAIAALIHFGGGHGPSFHPNGPPFGRSGAGQDSGPLQGETLGLPNALRLPQPSLAGLIVPIDKGCEFGSCGGGPIFGFADPAQDARIKELADGVSRRAGALDSPCFWATWTAAATISAGGVASASRQVAVTAGGESGAALPELGEAATTARTAVTTSKTWAFVRTAAPYFRGAYQSFRQQINNAGDWIERKANSVCDPRRY